MFLVTGCAKKAVAPPEVEVTPPVVETPKVTTEMDMAEMVDPEVEARRILDQEMAEFENRDISFEFDKFNLTPEARKILAEKASFLNANPGVNILIEGHCDERGTREYNLALGDRRANSAKDYLVFLGIRPDRISTISYGKERPLDPASNEEAWAKNRRANFVILNK
ncbi:MAG TPA: peptidoglycan-associated lipoprotein Pal [Deltaproteobacteria bacterium]|nr:peptidoglycan-associated lipoprotein Pal [Deltaproteobacteria bacterium]